jgi:hypothetical protein
MSNYPTAMLEISWRGSVTTPVNSVVRLRRASSPPDYVADFGQHENTPEIPECLLRSTRGDRALVGWMSVDPRELWRSTQSASSA